jgi:hypothetical protein
MHKPQKSIPSDQIQDFSLPEPVPYNLEDISDLGLSHDLSGELKQQLGLGWCPSTMSWTLHP